MTLYAGDEWARYIDLARFAEDAGVGKIVVVDHVVMGRNTSAYQWGAFPGTSDYPWLEPPSVLSAVAGATSRIRLATGILIAPLRPAALLAKTAATIVLSGGRLELGVAVGWQREEYDSCGIAWADRGRLLDEALEACQALWRGVPVTSRTDSFRFEEITCLPRPLQAGGVPFLIAGTLHRRNVARLVRWGSGWIPIMGEKPAGVAAGVRTLREAMLAHGRAARPRSPVNPPRRLGNPRSGPQHRRGR